MIFILLIVSTAIASRQKDNEVTESINEVEIMYTMPAESEMYEGTWLQ